MRDGDGYVLDEGDTYYYNMCLVVAKRFMHIVEEFDKLGFSQEQLNILIENLLDKLGDELEDFKFETSGDAPESAPLAVSLLPSGARQGHQCRNQFEEHGREFHGVSLWRGKLWLCTPQGTRSETGLCEAGSEQQSYSPSRIDLDRFE